MNNFSDRLEQEMQDIIDRRVKQWASYYFEKQLLPSLLNEIKRNITLSMYDEIGKIGFDVKFVKQLEGSDGRD